VRAVEEQTVASVAANLLSERRPSEFIVRVLMHDHGLSRREAFAVLARLKGFQVAPRLRRAS
jgi:hypothetical protein